MHVCGICTCTQYIIIIAIAIYIYGVLGGIVCTCIAIANIYDAERFVFTKGS